MLRAEDVGELVGSWRPGAEFRIEPLAGDASSNRRYYRVSLGDGAEKPRAAVLLEPVGPQPDGESPFVNVLRFLRGVTDSAPTLYGSDAAGRLLLEDFGDETMQNHVEGHATDVYRKWYRMAVDLALRTQIEGTRKATPECVAFGLKFDTAKLMWELDFFIEHVIRVWKGRELEPKDEAELRARMTELCDTLSAESKWFTHRDYHSRNLMVVNGRLGLLDFQDARLGPLQYDLVSLLRDSYVNMPEGLEAELIQHYLEGLRSEMEVDDEQFMRLYDYMVVQRNLKAAGSFAYLDRVQKKDRYLVNMPRCLAHVRRAFEARPELAPIDETLMKYIEELRPEAVS